MEIELLDLDGRASDPGAERGGPVPRRQLPWSGRLRSTLTVAGLLAVALLVAGGMLQGVLRDRLAGDRDRTLAARLDQLEGVVTDGPLPSVLATPGPDDVAQVLQSPGAIVASSAGRDLDPLPVAVPAPGRTTFTSTSTSTGDGPVPLRVAARLLPAPSGIASSTVLVVGAPLRPALDTVDAARRAYLAGVAVFVAVAAARTWRRAARPRSGRGDAQPARR